MTFDPTTFLNQSVTGPLSTRRDPVPVGDYRAQISKLEVRKVGSDDDFQPVLRLTWKLIDATELAAIGREIATVNQDVWLELDAGGNLDTSKGKNVSLGRLMETLGLNEGDRSLASLHGQVAIVKIGHRSDKKDPSVIYDEVQRVAALT